jgi:hypothetical protein
MILMFASSVDAAEKTSIVCQWAHSQQDCQDPGRRLEIRAMSISGFFSCVLKNVRRRANTVTWDGHCFSPDGNRRPETGNVRNAMTAKLVDGNLTLSGLGLGAGPLLRCTQ